MTEWITLGQVHVSSLNQAAQIDVRLPEYLDLVTGIQAEVELVTPVAKRPGLLPNKFGSLKLQFNGAYNPDVDMVVSSPGSYFGSHLSVDNSILKALRKGSRVSGHYIDSCQTLDTDGNPLEYKVNVVLRCEIFKKRGQ